jgi:acyl-CoA thioesterase
MVHSHSMVILYNIVTMDKSVVSLHTPETKQQSRQWLPKGQPGPAKAKVHATRTKQMVLAFFDSMGLIYTNYVPGGGGVTVNARYIVVALGKFMKIFRKKRPLMAARDWMFHLDNTLMHTATIVTRLYSGQADQLIQYPPYWPYPAPADFF